jgi:hypothetical protein
LGRDLAALLAAAVSGLGILALGELGGVVLYQRLLSGSIPALALIVAVASAIGGYAAWLVAVVVYSAVRSQAEEAASKPG